MAIPSDQAASVCSHCDRAIPSSNFDLHYAHCSRNLEKCKVCADMIPRKFAEEHFLSTHAPATLLLEVPCRTKPIAYRLLKKICSRIVFLRCEFYDGLGVSCSLCSETMEREILAVHKGENCPQRIVTCEYCEFPLPAIDLFEHQEVCGNRTELCHLCSRYVRLRERIVHDSRCNGVQENTAESSRGTREAERENNAQRRPPPHEFSRRRLLFTIAITGIAVLLGSLFFQRKTETNQLH